MYILKINDRVCCTENGGTCLFGKHTKSINYCETSQ